MRNSLRALPVFFLSAVFFAPSAASAEVLNLTYLESTRHAGQGSSISETVSLGEDRFSVREGDVEFLYDLKGRRFYAIDHAKKTYTNGSLYAVPAFKSAEFQNRLMLRQVLLKSGDPQAGGTFDHYSIESMFGLKDPDEKSAVEAAETPKGFEIELDGKTVGSVELSDRALAPDQMRMFAKYFSYQKAMHPALFAKWRSSGRVPREVSYTLKEMKDEMDVDLVLKSAEPGPEPPAAPPADYELRFDAPALLAEVIRKAVEGKSERRGKAWYLETAGRALDEKNYLDAMLLLTEYILETGDRETGVEFMRKLSGQGKDDPNLALYLKGSELSTEEAAKKSLELLARIDRRGLTHPYVIDIMAANAYQRLRDPQKAIELMTSVLQQNPYIGGVYKDLGDMFYMQYETLIAWECWDAGRKIAPGHPMFDAVNGLEKEIETRLPEYF